MGVKWIKTFITSNFHPLILKITSAFVNTLKNFYPACISICSKRKRFLLKVGERANFGNVCHYSIQKPNILSTFQNSEDQYIENNIATFTCGCGKWFLTSMEKHMFQAFGNKIRKIFGPTRN
jgi:hypothetical protein